MRAKGIDISKWQQEFIFQNNIDFVIIKATEGWGIDPWYRENLPEVMKCPIRGAYHYYRTATDPIVQVDNFLSNAAHGDFHFLAVDYEAKNNTLDYNGAENLLVMLSHLELEQDLPVVLYTSPYIYRDNLRHWFADFDTFALWLARYSGADPETGNPTTGIVDRDWDLWQNTDELDGEEHGTSSDYVDGNVYDGTAEEMKVWLGIKEPEEELGCHNTPCPTLQALIIATEEGFIEGDRQIEELAKKLHDHPDFFRKWDLIT